MPYADRAAQRAYQRKWIARRRAEFFDGKCCVECGATDELELDHIKRERKVHHAIWSWSEARRRAEIAKCVVRCGPCHRERHARERRCHGLGSYKRGCRCEVCRVAKRRANERYRRRRELNSGIGLCRPSRNHSATPPAPEANQLEIGTAA